MKRLAYFASLAVTVMLVFASIALAQSSEQPQTSRPTVEVTPVTTTTVNIQDHAFGPAELPITSGMTVTWVNMDSEPHTVTADNRSFGSAELSPGDSVSFKFDGEGTLEYHCALHPDMRGSITVSNDGGGHTSSLPGRPNANSTHPTDETTQPTNEYDKPLQRPGRDTEKI